MAETFTFRARVSGFEQMFKVQVDRLSDLTAPLRATAAEMRNEIREAFAKGQTRTGKPWEPLADSTTRRLQATRTGPVTATGKARAAYVTQTYKWLHRQQKAGKASRLAFEELGRLKRGGKASETIERSVVGSLRRLWRAGTSEAGQLLSGKTSGSEAFNRLRRAGSDEFGHLARGDVSDVAAFKRLRKALSQTDEQRAKVRKGGRAIDRHKILGRMVSMIRLKVTKGALRVGILNDSPLAIHNEGGKAGKNATEPARTFAELLPIDIERFIARIQQWIVPE